MNWIPKLPQILAGPLPGRPAQIEMASLKRLSELGDRWEVPPNARVAAVMLLLYSDPTTNQWRTVLIQRTQNPHDRHSGQVSFPGGSWDTSDGSLEAVALREVHEEVGIAPDQVQVLGRLTELYIPVSNFLVHPFVGQVVGQPVFVPQPGEVAQILTPGIEVFFEANNRKTKDITVGSNMVIRDAPYFDVDGHVLWGATAMMMNEFVSAVRTAQPSEAHV